MNLLSLTCLIAAEIIVFYLIYDLQDLFYQNKKNLIQNLQKRLSRNQYIKLSNTRTIIHEAGHAIAGWYCNLYFNIYIELFSMTKIEKQKYAGLCWANINKDYSSEYDYWAAAIYKLAGLAAEEVIMGECKFPCAEADLNSAYEFASMANFSTPPTNLFIGFDFDKDCQSKIDFSKILNKPVSEFDTIILNRCFALAKQLISAKRDQIDRLISLLYTKFSFTQKEFEAVLGKRDYIFKTNKLGTFFLC